MVKNRQGGNNGKQGDRGGPSTACMDLRNMNNEMKATLKDIKFLSSSRMSWKEKKEIENKKALYLGGKPQKSQRLPLSVARVQMKNQKKREEKLQKENMILGRFTKSKRSVERRRPVDNVLKASEGHFKNGILDVKSLLPRSKRNKETPSNEKDIGGTPAINKWKKNGSGKKKGKKGGSKKRH